MKKKKKFKHEVGSALLLTTILLFIILSMVVSLTYVTVMEQKMSSKTKSSIGSFYSAESGIEWALNKIATTSAANPIISDAFPGFSQGKTTCPSGFDCEVWLLDQNGKVITDSTTDLSEVKAVRSVGTQGNETTRAIEAAVAAGGSGCYVSYLSGCTGDACCITGFKNVGSAGQWGLCYHPTGSAHFYPAGGGCLISAGWNPNPIGEAFVCCK